MQKTPLISIIIPSYNSAAYICDAIASAVNQTYKEIEVIVIDDGSTDNSAILISEYIQQFSNVYFYKQTNKGACAARNFGLTKANGEYIQFLDSDDLLVEDKLERQVSYIGTEEVITFCNTINFLGDDTNAIISKTTKPDNLSLGDLISKFYVFTPTVLFPKQVFAKFGKFDEKLKRAQEHEFHVRLASKGYSFKNLFFEGVYVRHHNSTSRISNQNISGTVDNDIYMLTLVKEHILNYLDATPEDKEMLFAEFINLSIYKAQQHGNNKDFQSVQAIDKFIEVVLTDNNIKYKFKYKDSALYNNLLSQLGLTKFEVLRSKVRSFIK